MKDKTLARCVASGSSPSKTGRSCSSNGATHPRRAVGRCREDGSRQVRRCVARARREAIEETGLDLEIGELLGTAEIDAPPERFLVSDFLARHVASPGRRRHRETTPSRPVSFRSRRCST